MVGFRLNQLEPDTLYHYAVAVDGRPDLEKRGQFRTFPGGPASFTFAFGSCARTASSHAVFKTIQERQPLFFLNDGDWHYQNIKTNSRARFRAAYDRVLASRQQADLYRHVPFIYVWDDHDFAGENSDGRSRSREAARLTYEEYVPHYPLAAGAGDVPIYQAFSVGRARFILTDLRSERSPSKDKDDAAKTMLGARQKAWFKQELLAASGTYPLIFWVSSVPWIGLAGVNVYGPPITNVAGFFHHTNQPPRLSAPDKAPRPPKPRGVDWEVFSTERRELADFIKSNRIRGVCLLHGDAHMLAADDGTHSDYATGGGAPLPVMAAAPLDQHSSIKGGPYSQGVYKAKQGEGCFGLVQVRDAGEVIQVIFSGRNHRNEEKVTLKFEVPAK